MFMKVAIPYCARLMDDNKLRVTRQMGDYIYLKLKVGEYQKFFLDTVGKGELNLGEIVIKPGYCIFPVKNGFKPYTPEGILALDINEKT
jgi:hypothetical protein